MWKTEQALDRDLFSGVDFVQVFAELPQGVIITDSQGVVVFRNKAQASIDDLGIEETLGRKVTDIYELSEDNSMMMCCLRSKQAIQSQVFYYRVTNGPLRKVIHSVYPLFNGQELRGAICFVWDDELLQKQIASSKALVKDRDRDLGNNTRFTFADIIGADPDFLKSLKRARAAASTKSPVLIWGETGTGKELFAQAIHNHSPRRHRFFVAINCAAIPESLQESTLFGTVKGAFTGAVDKPGVFEQARNGTLYLDELDSMPELLQAKLLRVLQEKRLRRLGSSREVNVDLKIISSLSRNPSQAVQDGTLREDLYYRLGVIFISLSPLRKRKGDINILVWHFVSKLNCTLETDVQSISDNVMSKLLAYDWPGNVRQLEHTIEAAMNEVGEEKILDEKHFDRIYLSEEAQAKEPEAMPVFNPDKHLDRAQEMSQKDMSLQKFRSWQETEMIRRVLEETKGQMSKAARKLGISRQLLYYKLRKLGLDPKKFR